MTLLLYIAFLPRYQLRTQGGDGEEQEDRDGGDGGDDVPAHITNPVGRRLLELQVGVGGQAEGEGDAIKATPRRESFGLRAKRLLRKPDRLGNKPPILFPFLLIPFF